MVPEVVSDILYIIICVGLAEVYSSSVIDSFLEEVCQAHNIL